jgi:methanethiol S-methyltransferase
MISPSRCARYWNGKRRISRRSGSRSLLREPIHCMEYVILALLVLFWCVLHSALISVPVTEYLHGRLGPTFRFYRLFFNIVSLLTLIPIIVYASSVRTEPVFRWEGLRILQLLMLGAAALLFYLGACRYDAGRFLGSKQIREENSSKGLTEAGALDTSGVLGIIRHPWYLGSLFLIWSRPLDVSAILVNALLSCYLIAGAYLEERKLVREFGEKYRAYQKRVSMFLPYKWLKSKM